ncbi:MFS transporter [Pseudooceanicola aestuarii]|uniref:MFS transporter n=1 Tax=Pseudooceanicola aestuarii TaxID=2697319 RepID=UPI0013D011A9|nr:MFS transporter [Pseudooceanicola aestuarii]
MTDHPARGRLRLPPLPLATFFVVAGTMGTRPTIPLRAVELGLSATEVGILVAVFALVPLIGTIPAGGWMDRNGTARALPCAVLLTSLGLALPWLLHGALGLYASQLVTGCGFTIYILGAQKTAGAAGDGPQGREKAIAVFSLAVALGAFAGPFFTGFLGDLAGLEEALALAALLGLVSLVILPLIPARQTAGRADAALVAPPAQPAEAPADAGRDRRPWRVLGYHRYMGRAFLISSFVLLAKDFYMAYFPLLALENGMSVALIGVIIGLHNGGGVIMRVFQLRLVGTFGKSAVVITSILFSGICLLLVPFLSVVWTLTAVSIVMGMGLGLGQPLSISTTINLSPDGKSGEVLGFRLTCNRLTQFVTPLGFGGIVAVAGLAGAFWAVGAALVLGSLRLHIPDAET